MDYGRMEEKDCRAKSKDRGHFKILLLLKVLLNSGKRYVFNVFSELTRF
jgi:hypothetical protein